MDKALKQRLVGASVIIALAVVVLPMLLSGRPEGGVPETQKIEMPARPGELSFETRKFPVGENQRIPEIDAETEKAAETDANPVTGLPPESGTETETDTNSGAEADADGGEPASSESSEAVAPPELPPAQDQPTTQETQVVAVEDSVAVTTTPEAITSDPLPTPVKEPTGSGRYFVQVASLGSAENAGALEKSLKKLGYPVLMDSVDSDVGRLNRLRVGPYASESEAAKASAQIGKTVSGVNPRIIDLKPEQTASVTNPADPLVRWVVQIGSFGEASNAQKLVEKLRGDGMTAYSEQVTSASASVYRVRVGPFLERDEALRAKERLSKDFSLDGVVMSAD